MKTSFLFLMCAFAAAAQCGREIASGMAGFKGITIRYRTCVVPDTKDPAIRLMGSGTANGANAINRFIYDKNTESHFGYSMTVEAVDTAGNYRVTFGPMDVARVANALKAVAGDLPLNAAPMPAFPAPTIVHSGDTVALDLMVSPDGQHKIVDYLEIVGHNSSPEPSTAAMRAEPRDFTVDDGRVRFEMRPADLRVNGRKYDGVRAFTGSNDGATFWLSVPDHGRYILSLVPHDGFVKAGSIRDNVIAFQAEGQSYELRLAGTIAGTPDGAWNLYVFHDAGYHPAVDMAKGIWIGMDRLDNLISRR